MLSSKTKITEFEKISTMSNKKDRLCKNKYSGGQLDFYNQWTIDDLSQGKQFYSRIRVDLQSQMTK